MVVEQYPLHLLPGHAAAGEKAGGKAETPEAADSLAAEEGERGIRPAGAVPGRTSLGADKFVQEQADPGVLDKTWYSPIQYSY